MLNVAEKIALRVKANPAPQNKANRPRRQPVPIGLHPFGSITSLQRVLPDSLIGSFADIFALAVEHQRDQRLRNPEVACDLFLRNASFLYFHYQPRCELASK